MILAAHKPPPLLHDDAGAELDLELVVLSTWRLGLLLASLFDPIKPVDSYEKCKKDERREQKTEGKALTPEVAIDTCVKSTWILPWA